MEDVLAEMRRQIERELELARIRRARRFQNALIAAIMTFLWYWLWPAGR